MRWLFLLLVLSGCTFDNITGASITRESFIVTNVIDGDTLDLSSTDRVRLSGINAPEKGECYYNEAKNKLIELTLNKEVEVENDIDNSDKYGRLLRYIYVGDIDVNSYLIENGYVKVYDKYASNTRRYDELKEVEAIAVEKLLGVWSCENSFEECLYVGSKNSDLYHTPECKYAKRILPINQVCYKSKPEGKEFSGC